MRELLLAIAALAFIGLTVDLLIKVMSAAIKIAIATLISFLLIASLITLAITSS